jgi:hypothetical protein
MSPLSFERGENEVGTFHYGESRNDNQASAIQAQALGGNIVPDRRISRWVTPARGTKMSQASLR